MEQEPEFRQILKRYNERVEDSLKNVREALAEQTKVPVFGAVVLLMGAKENGRYPMIATHVDDALETKANMLMLADFFRQWVERLPDDRPSEIKE